MWLPKQPKTKLLGVLIDNQLLWREHVDKALKAFDNQLRVLRKMSYLPSHLLEETYLKTIISRVTYRIGVWGSCSVATKCLLKWKTCISRQEELFIKYRKTIWTMKSLTLSTGKTWNTYIKEDQ